jgi:protein-S-isoprenylcysteine O-methyltransferase Ste14
MRHFFQKPSGDVEGMKLIRASSSLFAIIHLICLLRVPVLYLGSAQVWVGATVYAASLALFWWAIQTNRAKPLSAAFSPDSPVHLVQQGPYRFVRHPFYTSYLLAWTAGVFATGQALLILTVVLMVVLYYRAAHYEEDKFRTSSLGPAYKSYRASTGLFFPNLSKPKSGAELSSKEQS